MMIFPPQPPTPKKKLVMFLHFVFFKPILVYFELVSHYHTTDFALYTCIIHV